MSWKDELLTSVSYTSPSGKSFSFNYDSGFSRETDLKTATFTFPGRDGAYIQSLGRGGRRFPFSVTFYGADCIKDADAFEAALCETGYGELQYPTGQKYKVVPTGTIKRSDNPVSSANQSTVEISFAETITDENFPTDSVQSTDAIAEAEESFEESAAEEFAQALAVENTSELLSARAVLAEQERIIIEPLEKIAVQDEDSYKAFCDIKVSLEVNINAFADDIESIAENAKTIAVQTIKIIKLPTKVPAPVLSKIEAYSNISASLIKNFTRNPIKTNNLKNQFAITKMNLQSLVVSVSTGISALAGADEADGGFASREDAVTAAIELANLQDSTQEYCDLKIKTIQAIESETPFSTFAETSESYCAMQEASQLSVAHVLNHSFSLRMRRVIVLDRDRQLLELLAELYGSIEEHLDEFVVDNRLNINEIALIPAGREVAYYG